ncbi:hypothetical protein BDR26DRAFT_895670 [Obelidium mucronatum]|nr:hypothetical protein BDR26DRAFT_895670 [Obelidium mucronatum]
MTVSYSVLERVPQEIWDQVLWYLDPRSQYRYCIATPSLQYIAWAIRSLNSTINYDGWKTDLDVIWPDWRSADTSSSGLDETVRQQLMLLKRLGNFRIDINAVNCQASDISRVSNVLSKMGLRVDTLSLESASFKISTWLDQLQPLVLRLLLVEPESHNSNTAISWDTFEWLDLGGSIGLKGLRRLYLETDLVETLTIPKAREVSQHHPHLEDIEIHGILHCDTCAHNLLGDIATTTTCVDDWDLAGWKVEDYHLERYESVLFTLSRKEGCAKEQEDGS